MEENRFYNYIYLDPTKPGNYTYQISENTTISIGYEPFYIGKGTGKRYRQHKYSPSGRFMKSKMTSLKNNKIEPIVILLNINSSNTKVCETEKLFIKKIGRRDLGLGPLCNLTDGGEEGYNRVIQQYQKDYMRSINTGKTLSEEHRQKIGKANKGKISNKTIEASKNYWKTHDKSLNSSKPVIQVDLNNNVIQEFKSAREAERQINISYKIISAWCKNPKRIPRKQNFTFRFK